MRLPKTKSLRIEALREQIARCERAKVLLETVPGAAKRLNATIAKCSAELAELEGGCVEAEPPQSRFQNDKTEVPK